MTTEQKRNIIFRAADILKQTDRGTKALKELKRALFGGLVGLDSVNQGQVRIIMEGFFGNYTGTARDAVSGYRPENWKKEKIAP